MGELNFGLRIAECGMRIVAAVYDRRLVLRSSTPVVIHREAKQSVIRRLLPRSVKIGVNLWPKPRFGINIAVTR